jgi:chemotaxis protein MotB
MAGRGHDEGGAHGGSWKIALADMMTVLMAFFLVMWLAAIVEPAQREQFAEALQNLSGAKDTVQQEESKGQQTIATEVITPIQDLKPPLTQEEILQTLNDPKNVEIEDTEDYTRITLKSDHFFEPGRATISDRVREELERLAEKLVGRPYPITITGYTDNVPIRNIQFPSNWELSAARAGTVARVFIDMGVDKRLITIQGRADNDAVAPNSTKYGRAMNRRVVITIDKKHRLNPKTGQIEPIE